MFRHGCHHQAPGTTIGTTSSEGLDFEVGLNCIRSCPPPRGRALDWGNTCPPQGGTNKKTRRQRIAHPRCRPLPRLPSVSHRFFVFLTARAKKTFLKRFPGRAKKTFLLYFAGPSPPPSPYTFKVDTYTSDPRAAASTLKHAGGGGRARNVFFARAGSGCYNKMVPSNARTDSTHEI